MKYNKNNFKDVIFPINFQFSKNDENLHIISKSGLTYFESPTMRYIKYISFTMMLLSAIIGISSNHYNNGYITIPALFAYIILSIGMILLLIYRANSSIETNFFVSSDGIEIKSNKGTVFIEKDNIEKIYSSKLIPNFWNRRNYIYYKIFLVCKKNIYLDIAKKYERNFSLFYDIEFTNISTTEFIINQFQKTLKLDKKREKIDSKSNINSHQKRK